jgi:hypothetical protein
MKVSIAVGSVEVTLSGLDIDVAQVRSLMRHAASIALALPRDEPDVTVDMDKSQPIGFTAHVDLDPDRGGYFGPPIYDDDEE